MIKNIDKEKFKAFFNKYRRRRLTAYCLAVLFFAVCFINFRSGANDNKQANAKVGGVSDSSDISNVESSDKTKKDTDTKGNDSSETKTKEEKKTSKKKAQSDDLSKLEELINQELEDNSGEWSVYVKNLDTGKFVSVNNKQIYAASLIKLFAIAGAYQQINEGILSESDIYDTLFNMITVSDNEAFNSVVWSIGRYYINQWCSENGYDNTVQCHGLYPASNADGLDIWAGYNMTDTEDVGKLLESIYKGECVSKECSEKMLEMLLKQEYRDKIPAGIPDKVKVASKTGETDDVNHDSAIVYSDGADYVLVIMTEIPGTAYNCDSQLAALSKTVYEYFNE